MGFVLLLESLDGDFRGRHRGCCGFFWLGEQRESKGHNIRSASAAESLGFFLTLNVPACLRVWLPVC